tara:strand:+ start:1 stop:1599 length:1599 start_codon:yes stop_codon:yes gene_type:complete
MMSETLGDSANRFAGELMEQIPPDYVAYTNVGLPAQLTSQWAGAGGTDPTPTADLIFMNPATNDYIRANVGAGKQQLMSSAQGESTALFNTMSNSGLVTPFTQRKEVKALTSNIKTKLSQILSGLEEKTQTIKEDVNDIISEATRIYDEISGKIEDLMSVDKNLKKEILREVLTGQLKFGPDSVASATHVIATNRDGTNTQVQLITDGYLSGLNDAASVTILFAPAEIENRLEMEETDGNTFIDYVRALVEGAEDSLNVNQLSVGGDFDATTNFNMDGDALATDMFSDTVKQQQEPPQLDSIEAKQNLRTMSQRAIENFNNIFDVMKFFSIGVEAIDIDPINLTVLNDKRADKYNIITINGKRFRVPVEREAQDIMDDYNYIDSAFKELVLEERDENTPRYYDKEYENYHSKPEQRANRSKRVLARRKMKKAGKVKKDQDVNHETALRNGGSNEMSNLKARDRSENRSDNGHHLGEEHGGGFMGTPELLLRYLKDTPYSGIIGYWPKKSEVKTKVKIKTKEDNGKKRKRKRK